MSASTGHVTAESSGAGSTPTSRVKSGTSCAVSCGMSRYQAADRQAASA